MLVACQLVNKVCVERVNDTLRDTLVGLPPAKNQTLVVLKDQVFLIILTGSIKHACDLHRDKARLGIIWFHTSDRSEVLVGATGGASPLLVSAPIEVSRGLGVCLACVSMCQLYWQQARHSPAQVDHTETVPWCYEDVDLTCAEKHRMGVSRFKFDQSIWPEFVPRFGARFK